MLCGAAVGVLGLMLMMLPTLLGDTGSGSPIDTESLVNAGVLGALFGSLGGLFLAVVGGLVIPLDTHTRIARRRALILTVIMTGLGCLASRAVLSMSGPWTPHGPVVSSSA